MTKTILLIGALFVCCSTGWSQTFNIMQYGAVPDGNTLNTLAIQKAVDECHRHGGGVVYVPAGVYITGTFHLDSNVDLYLESGSVLKGSGDMKDYETYSLPGYGTQHYGILYTHDAVNTTISGQGTIDGNDSVFFEWGKAKKIDPEGSRYTRQKDSFRKVSSGIGDGPVVPKEIRPHQLVIFSRCQHVQVRNISLLHSPFWTLHFADCDAVAVSGIRLWSNLLAPNADGIDVTSCTNVSISDCDIRSGDDAIAITGYDHHFEIPGFSGLRHNSANIVVTNCNLQSYSSGIRIGFLDQNTVRNVQISNINITNSSRGIGIFLRDEGSLENMTFSHIYIETKLRTGDWWGNGEPIHISAVRGKEKVALGKIKNIRFTDIICKGENGILVYGTEESRIEDLSFDRVSFELVNSPLNEAAGGNIDLRGCLDPQEQLFKHDIPGLFAQYVNGLSIHDFKLIWTDCRFPYFTHGIEVEHFRDLSIGDFKGKAAPSNPKAYPIFLREGEKATVTGDELSIKKESVK
jgi:polygalacturonase